MLIRLAGSELTGQLTQALSINVKKKTGIITGFLILRIGLKTFHHPPVSSTKFSKEYLIQKV